VVVAGGVRRGVTRDEHENDQKRHPGGRGREDDDPGLPARSRRSIGPSEEVIRQSAHYEELELGSNGA